MKENHILKIAVVDDDIFFGNLILTKLEHETNTNVTLFSNAGDFTRNLHKNPDIVIIDYNLPDENGIEILKKVKAFNPEIISIIISGQKELDVVVEVYKQHADRYIIKNEKAMIELSQNVESFRKNILLKKEFESLKNLVIERNNYQNIIGESEIMKQMFRLMQKVENINIPILITGANGSGKELVANALHYNSKRNRKPFIAINVAAIPEDLIESELFGSEKGAFTGASRRSGKFEEANHGTIFLDEIGEMPQKLQAKLLRILQENKVTRLGGKKEISLDIKIISATNKDLWEEVQNGKFREDLYFRLQGFIIELPKLKDRGNDIILLAKKFATDFCEKQNISLKNFSPNAIIAIMNYSWPGNVRELKSMIERAVLICNTDIIISDDFVFLEKKAS